MVELEGDYSLGYVQKGHWHNPLGFLRLAVPLRYAARCKVTGDHACLWGVLAPDALASLTSMFLRRYASYHSE